MEANKDSWVGKPYHVCLLGTEGTTGLLATADTEEQAVARCATANAEASRLGIPGRYEVRERQ